MRGQAPQGHRIRHFRKAHGWTQEQLAAAANCDVKTIRNAEASRRLRISTLNRIATALSIDLTELLDDSGAHHEEWIGRWVSAFNERKVDQLVGFYHHRATLNLPSKIAFPGSGMFRGPSRIVEHYRDLFAHAHIQFADPSNPFVQQQSGAVLLRGRATGKTLVNKKTLEVEVLHEFHRPKLLITSHVILLDTSSFLLQSASANT